MYNDLNQHKKSDAVKWVIVFILIAVLLVGMAASLTLTLSDKEEEKEEQAQEQAYANDFTAECISTANVKLAMNSVAMLAEDNSVSKTLTATVYPTDATNKLVDWSIEWSNPSKQEEVTDYVTVTPAYDGSSAHTKTQLVCEENGQVHPLGAPLLDGAWWLIDINGVPCTSCGGTGSAHRPLFKRQRPVRSDTLAL